MQKKYKNQAAFYIVYIREAHPTDGRQSGANTREGILIEQPTTFDARSDVALRMCVVLNLALPCLIDGVDNKVGNAYAGMPDRIYVVGTDGKIIFKGDRGPRGFKPEEAEKALTKYLSAEAEVTE